MLRTRMCNEVKLALLVIDEQHSVEFCEIPGTEGHAKIQCHVTKYQQDILKYMVVMGDPIWSISMANGTPGSDSTRPALKNLYNGKEHRLQKIYTNAFRETNLHMELQKLSITHLVVMGWHSNVCVPHTIGFPNEPEDIWHDSAVRLGYTVMTCAEILHGEPAEWAHKEPPNCDAGQLEFYSHF
ncbi:MAG: isochorismatase family protein [Psychromonas sp.]|nr:isochorismatase family protein [Psychromonas sp.]